jgi:transposase
MAPYSKEMRREILAACDRGEGTRAVALRFRCSESWVRRVKQERRELGKTAPLLTRRPHAEVGAVSRADVGADRRAA